MRNKIYKKELDLGERLREREGGGGGERGAWGEGEAEITERFKENLQR